MRTALILALSAGPVFAATDCSSLSDGILRLACYKKSAIPEKCVSYANDAILQTACIDRVHGRAIAPVAPDEARICQVLLPDKDATLQCYQAATPAPAKLVEDPGKTEDWTIQVREQSLPKFSKLKDPAQIGYKRESHRSDPIIKAGVIVDGPTLGFIDNWNWVGGLDLNIDLSAPAKQRANAKSLSAGARGTLFDFYHQGFTLDSNVRLTTKRDSELHTRSSGLVLGQLLLVEDLIDGGFGQQKNLPFLIVPSFGLSYEKLQKVGAGKPKGAYSSAYAGINIAVWPKALDRTQLTLKYQRFIDFNATGGLSRRYLSYTTFGIDYYLYDPTKDAPLFAPRIGLVREIGDDPLTSTVDKNRTLLVFKFTLN